MGKVYQIEIDDKYVPLLEAQEPNVEKWLKAVCMNQVDIEINKREAEKPKPTRDERIVGLER